MTTVHQIASYFYDDCTVLRWVDGDTIELTMRAHFDMGFKMVISGAFTGVFRLLDVDAFEKREPLGPAATAFVNGAMPVGTSVAAETVKDPDNFGRYLARLWLPGATHSINTQLLDMKLAVPYQGRTR